MGLRLTKFIVKVIISFKILIAILQKDLSLPIEDSQDMFNAATVPLPSSPSADLSLHLTLLEDSQFPQDTKKDSSLTKQRLDFRGIDCSQDQDELVGLCSGKFTGEINSHTDTFSPFDCDVLVLIL